VEMFTAEIVSIGNELLIGKTVNTNATWLGRKLTLLGYKVRRITVVPDEIEEISSAIRESLARDTKVIITTGGLGPTFDDKTSEALAYALNMRWIVNEEALKLVREKYKEMGLELTKHRVKLAKMPEKAKPIPNPVGSAPGILVEKGDSLIIALPGVPREMKEMFEKHVEPLLRDRGPKLAFYEDTIIIKGIPESSLAPFIDQVMKKVIKVYIKSHPKGAEGYKPVIELHITSSGKSLEEARKYVEEAKKKIINLVKDKAEILEG